MSGSKVVGGHEGGCTNELASCLKSRGRSVERSSLVLLFSRSLVRVLASECDAVEVAKERRLWSLLRDCVSV